jgi:hypothetical protein
MDVLVGSEQCSERLGIGAECVCVCISHRRRKKQSHHQSQSHLSTADCVLCVSGWLTEPRC